MRINLSFQVSLIMLHVGRGGDRTEGWEGGGVGGGGFEMGVC